MEFKLHHILGFLAAALVASEAAFSPEMYWKSKLPNTPMPQAIRDILHPALVEEKSTSVGRGKGGVGVSTGKRTDVGVGKGRVPVRTGSKGKPVHAGVTPDSFIYLYEASDTQVDADPNVAKFFLEKDLTAGKSMILLFARSTNLATFLPRQVAGSLPFSTNDLPEALSQLSVKPGSIEAEMMATTIRECEEPGIKGEEKFCATSLESMVDYTRYKLGNDVQAVSSEVGKETGTQKYKIEGGAKKIMGKGSKYVVCHKQKYPYAVFYCHKTMSTKVYVVPLKGEDGSKVKAVAVCHTDTSEWNPKHLAFRVLGVKPGSVPICHFLPQDHIVWYTN